MPSFSTPLSGLDAESQALAIIANNLANLNTIGYKSSRTLFQDLFYQQIGSSGDGNPVQVGVGATVAAVDSMFTQGSIQSTGVPTDVAIEGDGFFVADLNGLRVYTRAGNFSLDAAGHLRTTDGAVVLGYPASNGVVDPNQPLAPLVIARGQTSPPKATTSVQLQLNLDASANIGDSFSTALAVYDSLGGTHVLTFRFTKAGTNSWNYEIDVPAADVGQSGTSVVVQSGSLSFDGTGRLLSPPSNVTGITINNLADGAANLVFDWNLYDASGNPLLTQVAAPSATSATAQDGYASGTLVNFNIQSDGVIQGIFSNGQTVALGQIALATFTNPQGLIRNGQNEFLASLASGAPNTGAPGSGGRGTLIGASLEQSNVDIAREFTNLILAERGYQANARAVTTFDEVTQEAINLKR